VGRKGVVQIVRVIKHPRVAILRSVAAILFSSLWPRLKCLTSSAKVDSIFLLGFRSNRFQKVPFTVPCMGDWPGVEVLDLSVNGKG